MSLVNDVMRVGIIGVGSMGRNHVRVYGELGAEIVGVADIDSDTAREVAGTHGLKAYADYNDLLRQGLDAVSIAVPTTLHREVGLSAIEQGAHVLIEKPIAESLQSANELILAARQSGLILMIGHIERFNPAVQKMQAIIHEGVLGDLVVLSSRRVGPFVPRIKDIGIVLDSATHDIDIARYLIAREPSALFARCNRTKHHRGDSAVIVLDFDQVAASLEVNWLTPHKVRSLVATGTDAIAYVDYIQQTITVHSASWRMEPTIEKQEPLKLELKHFLECVKKDQPPVVDGEDGLKTLKVALDIERTFLG